MGSCACVEQCATVDLCHQILWKKVAKSVREMYCSMNCPFACMFDSFAVLGLCATVRDSARGSEDDAWCWFY